MARTRTTTDNESDVADFLAGIDDDKNRVDAMKMCALMMEATGVEPALWPPSSIGFGSFRLRRPSGDLEESMTVGFAVDDGRLAVRLLDDVDGYRDQLDRLGPHSVEESTVLIDRFDAVDQRTLRRIVNQAFHSRDGRDVAIDRAHDA